MPHVARQAGLHLDAKPPWAHLLARIDWPTTRRQLGLSNRETEIARRQILGTSMEEISDDLGLGLGTVKTYARRLYRKLGVTGRCELTLAVLAVALPVDRSDD